MVNKKNRKQWSKIIQLTLVVIALALVVEIFILRFINRITAYKTTGLILDQVTSIIEKNERSEKQLTAGLKEEFILRAKVASYILDDKDDKALTIEELNKIAELSYVDEIHLIDSTGRIYNGSVPEYYDMTFESGEQIGFFKPMLSDKGLSMCQDVMPNTAKGKYMSYAITWNEAGTRMIQVGIEPVRLIDELKNNSIDVVIDNMPTFEGINIYVSDVETGVIHGATNKSFIGKKMEDIGFKENLQQTTETIKTSLHINGFDCYAKYKTHSNYLVCVVYSTENTLNSFILVMSFELLYLCAAAAIIFIILSKVFKANEERDEQYTVLNAMSTIYNSMHLLDLKNNSVIEYAALPEISKITSNFTDIKEIMCRSVEATVQQEFLDNVKAFTDFETLADRMQGRQLISTEFVSSHGDWYRAFFVRIDSSENNDLEKVIFATRNISLEKKKEERLIYKSQTDELTNCYNRRAYEDDLKCLSVDSDFIYVSMDVNGLKLINDNMGHAAGDELIQGAASCMKKVFGQFGKVYRIGGDEFVAILNVDENKFEQIQKDFENTIDNWKGELLETMTISMGVVANTEQKWNSILEVTKTADSRMYENKSSYYRKKGFDRRGQKDAHTALCNLYTKILKINLTQDTFQIVNMENDEKNVEKGFNNTISGWLRDFGTSGQVHPEDLDEYLEKTNIEFLRNHFLQENTSLSIFYRRKILNEYKHVVMEIIPANDYSPSEQNCFLYVKSIDL